MAFNSVKMSTLSNISFSQLSCPAVKLLISKLYSQYRFYIFIMTLLKQIVSIYWNYIFC